MAEYDSLLHFQLFGVQIVMDYCKRLISEFSKHFGAPVDLGKNEVNWGWGIVNW